ncbi:hypothetical protein UY416_01225 [Paenibacillus polymyxa]|uniref:hypothetical protein n=2 Tax=Paenibacillus TaxID=44249 RepID=UPI002AB4E75F|nr:hypothetical protein [Paenibacillus polymyxa]MDY8044914.1 hypothetical protein [Paenibacillus polymyxa]
MQYASNAKKEEIVRTGIPIGKEYIKEYYRADFILKDYVVDDPAIHSRIYLYGYIKGHEDSKITIYYNYKTKEVIDVSGPAWFIDSRNPKKNRILNHDCRKGSLGAFFSRR